MNTREHQRLLSKYKLENKPTKYELIVEELLKTFNIKYIKQKGFLSNIHTCYIADFYIPKPYKIIIEVDGEYHNKRQVYDYYRDKYFLEERGIKTIRFTNKQVIEDMNSIKVRLTSLFNKDS